MATCDLVPALGGGVPALGGGDPQDGRGYVVMPPALLPEKLGGK